MKRAHGLRVSRFSFFSMGLIDRFDEWSWVDLVFHRGLPTTTNERVKWVCLVLSYKLFHISRLKVGILSIDQANSSTDNCQHEYDCQSISRAPDTTPNSGVRKVKGVMRDTEYF